jgi:hypothetical protein
VATDWKALKNEYVNTSIQYAEMALKYGIKAGTIRQHAKREGWPAARNAASQLVTAAATQRMTLTRAEELSNFNNDDVRVAKAIRANAAAMLKTARQPHELRSLAGAFESAQRIGRLALGAFTDKHEMTGKDGKDLATPAAPVIHLILTDAARNGKNK